MSIIIEIEDDEVFVHRNYYHEACYPNWKEGDIHKVESIEERHKCWECQEWIEAEQTPEDIAQEYLDAYHAEQGMQAFEDAMWGKWKRENAIEPVEGFFIGQQVWERDTFADGVITDIDEDGIATVLFSNGSTDGIGLEDLTTSEDPRREEF